MPSPYDYTPFGPRITDPSAKLPPTFLDAATASFTTGLTSRGVVAGENIGWAMEDAFDPTFGLEEKDFKGLVDGLPKDLADSVLSAGSWREAFARRENIDTMAQARRRLSDYGWGSGAVDFATQMFDPGNVSIGLLTAGAASAGTVAGRAALAARAGLATTAELELLAALPGAAAQFSRATVPTAASLVESAGASAGLNVMARQGLTRIGMGAESAARLAHSGGGVFASGLENAAINAGIEGALAASGDPESDAQSAMFAALFGFTMGSAFRGAGEVFGGANRSAQLALRSILQDSLDEHIGAIRGDQEWNTRDPVQMREGAVGDVGSVRGQKPDPAKVVESYHQKGLFDNSPETVEVVRQELDDSDPEITAGEMNDLAYLDARRVMLDPASTPEQRAGARQTVSDLLRGGEAIPRQPDYLINADEAVDTATGEVTTVGKAARALLEARNQVELAMETRAPVSARSIAEENLRVAQEALNKARSELDAANGKAMPPPPEIIPPERPKNGNDYFPGLPNRSKAEGGRVTWWGKFGTSGSTKVREIASVAVGDSLMRADGSMVSPNDAAGWAHRNIARLWNGEWMAQVAPIYREWAKSNPNKPKWWDFFAAKQAFNKEVTLAMHGLSDDPHALRAAEVWKKINNETLTQLKLANVLGADIVPYDPNHVTRIFSGTAINNFMRDNGGIKGLTALIAKGLETTVEFAKHTPEERLAIARGYATTISKLDHMRFVDAPASERINGDISDDVARAFTDLGVNNPDLLAQTIYRLRQETEPTSAILKRQLPLDIRASIFDKSGREIRIADLLELNADTLVSGYVRQASHITAGGEILKALSVAHKENYRTFGDLMAAVKREFSIHEIDHRPGTRGANDLDKLARLFKYFEGKPMDEVGSRAFHEATRTMLAVNNMLYPAGFAPAQIPEAVGAAAMAGIHNYVKQLPVVADLFKSFITGKVETAMLKEIQNMGHALNRGFDHRVLSVDTFGTETYAQNRKWYLMMQKMGDWVGFTALFTPIQRLTEGWYAAGRLQGLHELAASGRAMDTPQLERLRLTPDQWTGIAADFAKHGKVVGDRLDDPNFATWSPENASLFKAALSFEANTIVQRPELGGRIEGTQSLGAQILLQYRGFAILSYERQMRNGWQRLSRRDWQYGMAASFQTLTAGLVYAAQQYSKSLSMGEEEATAYRAKMLSPGAIVLGGFGKAGWSSLLPTAGDYALYALGSDTRTSSHAPGLSVLDLLGNPTVSTIDSALRAGSSLTNQVWGDRRWTRADSRAWFNLMPMRRAVGWSNLAETVINQSPSVHTPTR